MLDRIREDGESELPERVRVALLVAFWIPVMMILWATGIAILRIAFIVDPTQLIANLPVDPAVALTVGVGAITYLYVIVAIESFGKETVEEAKETHDSLSDTEAAEDDGGDEG